MKKRLMCILCLLYALSALGMLFSGCLNPNFEQEYYNRIDEERAEKARKDSEYKLWEQQVRQDEQSAQRFSDFNSPQEEQSPEQSGSFY